MIHRYDVARLLPLPSLAVRCKRHIRDGDPTSGDRQKTQHGTRPSPTPITCPNSSMFTVSERGRGSAVAELGDSRMRWRDADGCGDLEDWEAAGPLSMYGSRTRVFAWRGSAGHRGNRCPCSHSALSPLGTRTASEACSGFGSSLKVGDAV